MDDLISRKAAIETAKKMYVACDTNSIDDYEMLMEDASDVDVVEVVRCNDCKYAEYIDDVKTLWCTECGQGRTVAPDDFCSRAERRTE